MSRQRDLTGQRFGAWRVTGPAERDRNRQMRWHCVCDCTRTGVVFQSALVTGKSMTCGCSQLGRRPIRVGRNTPPAVIAGAAASLFAPAADTFAPLRAPRGRRRQIGSMS